MVRFTTLTTVNEFTCCRCSEYFLLMAGSCVDQNIIIGVFAGVGGALFVALIIAVIYLKNKQDSSGKTMDSDSR